MRVLFLMDAMPCHRFLKEARALNDLGMELYMCYRSRGAATSKDADLSLFHKILKLKKRDWFQKNKVMNFISQNKIEIIHFHNYPDKLCYQVMHYNLDIPIIFDQHDLMSLQRVKFSKKKLKFEKYCHENADGLIFVTDLHKKKSQELYNIKAPTVVLHNMMPGNQAKIIPQKTEKLSDQDGKIHLVWIGLIINNESHHRYLIPSFKILTEAGFIIHIYPTRSKEYPKYKAIKNIVFHRQLSYNDLIKEISMYDAGLAIFNPFMLDPRRSEFIKYAFPNKVADYVFANIPSITLNNFQSMSDFVNKYKVGYSFDNLEDIKPDLIKKKLSSNKQKISDNLNNIFMDVNEQIKNVLLLYQKLIDSKK
ncbi:MAG: glycosyltransferase [Candidatus Stygibacter australis]|nr:glycosyltransferase [Candidatus Stygibacter australis]